jgi:hypothetical protein
MAGTIVSDTLQDGAGNSTTTTNAIKGSAKVWANFSGATSSPLTVNGSYNVGSITRSALGSYTVNFSYAVTGTYAVAISGASALGASTTGIWLIVTNQNTYGFSIQCLGSNGANFDITTGNFAVFSS